jgi:serine/threonine protein phosphatase PrpC
VFSNANILQKLQPISGNNSNSLRKENNNSALCENTRNKKNMSKIQIDDFNSCLPNRPQNLINNINVLTTMKSPSHKLFKKVEITNKNNHNYNTNSTNNLILNNSNSSNVPSTKPINNSPNTITLVYNNSSKNTKVNNKTLNTNDSSLQSNQLHNLSHNNNISRQNTISQNNSILNISNSQPNLISTQPSPKCVYCYKEDQNTFFRDKMEDMEKIVDNFANDPYKQLFCLFDGHGTGDVAKYAKDSFPEIFLNYLNIHKNNTEKALMAAFLKIDEEIKSHVQSENAGSTACVCYLTHEGNKKVLYIANVGDTRAVMLTKQGIKRLSYDHKCSDTSEEVRVKNSGGIIFNGRVFGQLILSRALGDHSLKNCGVICTPYVNKHTICENDFYVLIASDGVWDVIKEEDLVNIFSNNSCMNTNQLAGLIVSTALELESKDNISCILIKLN